MNDAERDALYNEADDVLYNQTDRPVHLLERVFASDEVQSAIRGKIFADFIPPDQALAQQFNIKALAEAVGDHIRATQFLDGWGRDIGQYHAIDKGVKAMTLDTANPVSEEDRREFIERARSDIGNLTSNGHSGASMVAPLLSKQCGA